MSGEDGLDNIEQDLKRVGAVKVGRERATKAKLGIQIG